LLLPYVLKDAGAALSPHRRAVSRRSIKVRYLSSRPKLTKRFRTDTAAQAELANTKKLADVSADDFDAVFYPGGHGPMWDMPDNATSRIDRSLREADKPVVVVSRAGRVVNVRGRRYLVRQARDRVHECRRRRSGA